VGLRGNQVARIRIPARAVESFSGSPFSERLWEGQEEPLSEIRIRGYLAADQGLPPEPGRYGGDLQALDDHERRVAWLMANHGAWSPATIVSVVGEGSSGFGLLDGHHRFTAALILGTDLDCDLVAGFRSEIEPLLADWGGQWLKRPESEVFGDGVFPQSPGSRRGLRAYGQQGRCWVEDIVTGEVVARYGPRIWTAEAAWPLQGAGVGQGQAVLNSGDPTEHRKAFASACSALLQNEESGLPDYILSLIGGSAVRPRSA